MIDFCWQAAVKLFSQKERVRDKFALAKLDAIGMHRQLNKVLQ
jgi:hypothetical protein